MREIKVDHEDFLLRLPLRVCRRCANRPPFPQRRFWPPWQLRPRVPAGEAAPTLRDLFETVPVYGRLLQAFPESTLSSAREDGPRETGDDSEAKRFARAAHVRRYCFYLLDGADLPRSRLPPVVLAGYSEIIDRRLKRLAEDAALRDPFVIQVAAVLLPGRQWRFDTQIVASTRRLPRERLLAEVGRFLDSLPAWPVAYPIVFGVRRAIGNTPATLYNELLQPFKSWSARLVLPGVSYSEMARRIYEVAVPQEPLRWTPKTAPPFVAACPTAWRSSFCTQKSCGYCNGTKKRSRFMTL